MKVKVGPVSWLIATIGLLVSVSAATAGIPSWSAFDPATLSGISLDQNFANGVTSYTLDVDKGATIAIEGKTYRVNWIQAFCVVGATQNAKFMAAKGCGKSDWSWGTKSNHGQVAGWSGTGNNRLYPGQSKTFNFDTFSIDKGDVLCGFHIGYQSGCCDEKSGWFKCMSDVPSVPEPSSFAVLVPGVVALAATAKRRLKKSE